MPSKTKNIKNLRDFPSVEILSGEKALSPYIKDLTKGLVIEVIRNVIEKSKQEFKESKKPQEKRAIVAEIQKELHRWRLLRLQPVINGAGIIIHTNLGRAPLSQAMIEKAGAMLTGYSNLEFDLSTGSRGRRGVVIEKLLAILCGTESGTLVNNNAAALFIILNTLANRKEVIISRGELVQIGGGFRIPNIMKKAGVKLAEIGTTNRTTLADYKEAITERSRMILKVHRSNFVQEGFVEEVTVKSLSQLSRQHKLILVHDLGSGLVSFPQGIEITGEPSIFESVRAGADLTCFSGDKLLGGTQAGLIAGRRELIKGIKKNALFRTLRCDKFVFSITAQILMAYINGQQDKEIPVWKMINTPVSSLKRRGETIIAPFSDKEISLVATRAFLGGGSTPTKSLPSMAISIRSKVKPNSLAAKFRYYSPPIIGRVEKDEFLIDLRSIPEEFDSVIGQAIRKIVS